MNSLDLSGWQVSDGGIISPQVPADTTDQKRKGLPGLFCQRSTVDLDRYSFSKRREKVSRVVFVCVAGLENAY